MKRNLLMSLLLSIVAFAFSVNITLNMDLGDYFDISNFEKFSGELPGSYIDDGNIFFRADGSASKYNFEIDDNKYTINVENSTSDSTVLFVDEFHKDKIYSNINYFLKEIGSAKKYIYMSVYDIDLKEFYDLLIKKADEGVKIKIVTEEDNRNYYSEKLKENEKIELKYDDNYRLMHNKFIIIDGYLLITGSTNITNNGLKYNDNNMLFIFNNEITENYMLEFEEQFDKGLYGKKGKDEKKYIDIPLLKGDINSYFTPDENYQEDILKLIDSAKKEIKVMIFTFTDSKIAQALLESYKRGVKVQVITEAFQAGSRWSVYGDYQNEFPFILDKNGKTFHHKLILIDGKYILTGSYNFTKSALEYNDENAVIINNNPVLYNAYEKEFDFLWQEYSK